ncbi:MAG: hypothetical protein ABIK09_03020 [Pseudomonadota bacterium]
MVDVVGDVAEDGPPDPIILPQEFLEQEVTWAPCPLHDGNKSGVAECADITVPFFWEDPKSDVFTVHVKRLVQEGSERQLFMLEGGPGFPGTDTLSQEMERVFQADPKMDVYALDHRGTGLSHAMTCPEQGSPDSPGGRKIQGSEWEDCAAYLEAEWGPLDGFTVSAAAADVALLVSLVSEPGKARLVYGQSYGTYWAHRYAVLFPRQPDAVVLDSLVPPAGYQVDIQDLEENEVTKAIFERCAEDDLCSAKLGEDPAGFAADVFQDYKDGLICDKLQSLNVTPSALQQFIINLGLYDWHGRSLIPAIFYRLDRCTDEDAVAIYNAIAFYTAEEVYWRQEMSTIIGRFLMLSEMVYEPAGGAMTLEEILAYEADLISTRYLSYFNTVQLAYWPRYPLDEAYGKWAPPEVPILILHGDLNYRTPLASVADAEERLTGPHQHFVVLPGVRDSAMFESPMDETFETDCGFEIAMAWLKDPSAAPDTSCVDVILPVDFAGDEEFLAETMQTEELWEDEPEVINCGQPDDFLAPFADDHAVMEVIGEIGGIEGLSVSDAEFHIVVGGQDFFLDDGTLSVAASSFYGQEYVKVHKEGNFEYYSSSHFRYISVWVTFPKTMLKDLKDSGEHLLPANSELGVVKFTIADVEVKQTGEPGSDDSHNNYRVCPLAAADPSEPVNAFWICHDDNQTFSGGELLRFAGNVALSTDPDLLKELYNTWLTCFCWRDGGGYLFCSDFDAL